MPTVSPGSRLRLPLMRSTASSMASSRWMPFSFLILPQFRPCVPFSCMGNSPPKMTSPLVSTLWLDSSLGPWAPLTAGASDVTSDVSTNSPPGEERVFKGAISREVWLLLGPHRHRGGCQLLTHTTDTEQDVSCSHTPQTQRRMSAANTHHRHRGGCQLLTHTTEIQRRMSAAHTQQSDTEEDVRFSHTIDRHLSVEVIGNLSPLTILVAFQFNVRM